MTRSRRARPGLIAILLLLTTSFVSVAPVSAAANTLSFPPDGEPTAVFGANDVIRIDGSITYETNCPEDGIDDWVYPATDVYIVESGATGGLLEDVGGGRPNTIVATTSVFLEEIVGVTLPSGQLGDGVYDVVYDTCQDGYYDPGLDTVFAGAITIALPTVLPPASAAIQAMKADSYDEYLSWLDAQRRMSKVFDLAERALKTQCKAGNPIGCVMKKLDYFDGVKERFLTLMLSEANHYLAIAMDPPDADFRRVTTVDPIAEPFARSDSAVSTATSDLLVPLATEAAISKALLRAVERYQGAVVAGDAPYALEHAREARRLATLLGDARSASTAAIGRLRTAFATEPDLDAAVAHAITFSSRVWSHGFNADERRALLNQGLSPTEVAQAETDVRNAYADGSTNLPGVLQSLDDMLAARAETSASAATAATAWAAIVTELETGAPFDAAGPGADAGGPYTVAEGAPLTLHGSSGEPVDAAAWDLDADGAFDDATGLEPTASFATAGPRLVGLRVARGERVSAAYALVNVGEAGHAPAIADPNPVARAATVIVGANRSFSVSASDADGDALTFAWSVDGEPVPATGPSFTFTPTAGQVGLRQVVVVVSDGTAAGGSTRRAWDVVVLAADADSDGWTATTDCDDAVAVVHPTANELLGNGVDDDCDAGTPDAPPGGLTGRMGSWGSNHNGSVGSGSYSPTIVESPHLIADHDDIVQVDSTDRGGFAVTSSGGVLGWGFGLSGEMGRGDQYGSATPVSPFAIGGGGGQLSGVTQISGHAHIAARRADGTVASWGANGSGQVGDGSTVNYRLYPVLVQSAPGGPPLTGVRAVETGYLETYAIMDDGTVRAWGITRCDGGTNVRIERHPIELDLVGGNVQQVSSGNQWTLFRLGDGSVLSCGTTSPTAGRPVPTMADVYTPKPISTFGPANPAIDIASGHEGGMALDAQGRVWMWGYNANGSLSVLGTAGGGSVPLPVQVPLPPGPPVVDVDMDGACHALALRADGSTLAWGCDFFGQIGDGAGGDGIQETPTVIPIADRTTVSVTSSIWNSLVLTRPADDPAWERPATWVKASVADVSLGEATGGTFEVGISAALPQAVTVDWAIEAGTAGSSDLQLANGSATIPAGATSASIPVTIHDDVLDEDDEGFTIRLTDASNGIGFARSQANGTIVDDDAAPTVSVEPATITEGHTSITDVPVRISLSAPSGKVVSVAYATSDDSATAPADYASATGRVVIAPGETGADLHLAVRGDGVAEPDERFALELSAPSGATLGTSSAWIGIEDDEPVVLEVTSPVVTEGNTGTTSASFTVKLDPAPPAGTTITVPYHVQGLSASVPGDVAAATGTLEFGPGDGPKQVSVEIAGDTVAETDEVFRLALGTPSASDGRTVLAGDNPPAVILDDDAEAPPPPPSNRPPTVDAGPPAAGSEGSAIALVPTASDPDGDALSAAWTWQSGAGVASGATCWFGDASAMATTLTCTDDGTWTARLVVTDPAGQQAADEVTVTVANVDPTVVITAPVDLSTVGAGATIGLSAAITDPGDADGHTCTIDWGDGSSGAGSIASGRCTASHAYAAPAAPSVRVTVTDDDGGTGSDEILLVVTTPATKVNGGGWIESAGARTSFGFVAAPEGAGFAGEIQVIGPGHRFHGHTVTNLVTARPAANWSGTGRWDGQSGYTYAVSVVDSRNGGDRKGSPDSISIEIRDASGAVVFAGAGSLQGGNLRVG